MQWNVILIPLTIVVGGLVAALTLPLDMKLRILIFMGDCFAAMVIGLVLWRRRNVL